MNLFFQKNKKKVKKMIMKLGRFIKIKLMIQIIIMIKILQWLEINKNKENFILIKKKKNIKDVNLIFILIL